MKNSTLVSALLALGTLHGCGGEPGAPAQSESPPPADAAPSQTLEATSFGGEPLYRNPVPRERLTELQTQIAPLEAEESLTEDEYITLGALYIGANRFRDAIDLYTRGLEDYPDSFRLRRHRGHRYINVREPNKAIVDLREALELIGDEHGDVLEYNLAGEPTGTYEHWVWYHVGLYHYLNEEWGAAAAAYQNCVDTATTNPNLVGATDWLYNALMKGGEREAAATALEAVPADFDTNREHPYFKRVMVYKGELDPREVIDIDKPASEWSGFDITAGYGIGNWFRFNGDDATADRIHEKILQTPYWNSWAYVVTDREFARR